MVLAGNSLLRIANSAGTLLISFYLASLATQGAEIEAGLVGALAIVSNLAEFGGSVPFGALADRYSPRKLLIGSSLVAGGATQLFGISGLVLLFFLSRTLEGLAASATTPRFAPPFVRRNPSFICLAESGHELF